ncbi:MAG TPA: hypothetical protein PKC80_01610 [Burkholderiaceae bacterium]|nr:hypothetical protein [Burkholderiaceae bacterium]
MAQSSLQTIFKKTEKGMLALKVRDHALSFKLRSLLIMVDGIKTIEQLGQVTTSGAEIQEHIDLLQEQEYVQVVSMPAASSNTVNVEQQAPTAIVAPATQTTALPSLQTAIRQSTKSLIDLLGPNSDSLCMQLEKCKSIDQYNERILAFRKVISGMRNETIANDFVKNAIL